MIAVQIRDAGELDTLMDAEEYEDFIEASEEDD
jgi:hypothetical protein